LPKQTLAEAELTLRSKADARAYLELLPYILDPHGPGSRLSVKRNPQTGTARARKRAEGVFYTPADVAEYMAGACLDFLDRLCPPMVFDPACGTGVFLRAALKQLRILYPRQNAFSLASTCLFGADIDPWPLDAAAFVLFADMWPCLEGNSGLATAASSRRCTIAC
jgi:type I restriction-modification system DNA methylase subunit